MRVVMKATLERGGDGVSCEVFFFSFFLSSSFAGCALVFFVFLHVYGSGVLRCPRREEDGEKGTANGKGRCRAYRRTTASTNTLHIINESLPMFSPCHNAAPKTVSMKIMNHRAAFTHWNTRYRSGFSVPRAKRMISALSRKMQVKQISMVRIPSLFWGGKTLVGWVSGRGWWEQRELGRREGTLKRSTEQPRSGRRGGR